MLQQLLEFESIERLIPDRITGRITESDSPAVYAITSGTWVFETEKIEGEMRLHPVDILLLSYPIPHQLHLLVDVPTTENLFSTGILRLTCSRSDQGDSSSGVQESGVTHLRSAFVPNPVSNGTADLLREVSQLILSLLLASQSHEQKSESLSGVDPEIAQAILAMERAPAHAWTIQRLAMEAGISRSAMALKFKEQTGQTPSEYLLNVRMKLADDMLRGRRQHLKEIARRTGYQSVSAFSTAFKRWSGSPPSVHRRRPTT